MNRAMSVSQVINKKRELMHFTGAWKDSFGCPEMSASWIVWGESGSGKTTFTMMMCKYLSQFGRVAYDSLEEGDSESIKKAMIRADMEGISGRFVLLDKEPIDELKERLRKHKAPRIVVIDSVQFSGINYNDYKKLRQEFRNTLFIFISHADGKFPSGMTAQRIRYDASIKVRVEGYQAFVNTRYLDEEGEPYVIWEEGAAKYHGIE